jgi:hypothetical protein
VPDGVQAVSAAYVVLAVGTTTMHDPASGSVR